ncbi:Mitochondrial transcription factor 1 [Tulasnella sp. 424]|nr:Mitochondrial transcription factor 1 [Tulasnella sp. 424]KAG8977197.1 Mitochondrial transcription factor 1 [Tulasnella sp. 425]
MLQPRIQSLTRWSVIARRAYSTGTTTVQPIKRAPSNLDIRDEDWTFVSGATGKALPPVPPLIEWPKRYPMKKGVGSADRSYLFNPAAAREVVKTYGLEENGHPKIVLETYPGPGVLSRALLTLPRTTLKKLIICEYGRSFHPDLEALAAADDRVVLVKEGAYYWNVYHDLEAQGHFADLPRLSFEDGIHPNFRMVGHLPLSVLAAQWLSQILRAVADRAWMFAYGRIPVHLLIPEPQWARISAPPLSKDRCKLSVIAQANTDFSTSLPAEDLKPYNSFFFPRGHDATTKKLRDSVVGNNMLAVNFIPKAEPIITVADSDEWDFLARQLFVNKTLSLEKSLSYLAPGASILLEHVTDPKLPLEARIPPKTPIRGLTIEQWKSLANAFSKWPFKPDNIKALTSDEWREIEVGRK